MIISKCTPAPVLTLAEVAKVAPRLSKAPLMAQVLEVYAANHWCETDEETAEVLDIPLADLRRLALRPAPKLTTYCKESPVMLALASGVSAEIIQSILEEVLGCAPEVPRIKPGISINPIAIRRNSF